MAYTGTILVQCISRETTARSSAGPDRIIPAQSMRKKQGAFIASTYVDCTAIRTMGRRKGPNVDATLHTNCSPGIVCLRRPPPMVCSDNANRNQREI
jgi:hypothetical protein